MSRGLVVAPDIGGIRPLFDDLVDRLSTEHGWAVTAVEPFPGRESMTLEERFAALPGLDHEAMVERLVAAADGLGTEPVGVIGFCMGGMFTLKAVASGRFDRGVAFYGMIRQPQDWRGGDGPPDAIDLLRQSGNADRVLFVAGTADQFTPPDDLDDLEALGATVVRYEGAEHGFVHDPSRPVHRADDAADAWRRAVEWLAV